MSNEDQCYDIAEEIGIIGKDSWTELNKLPAVLSDRCLYRLYVILDMYDY